MNRGWVARLTEEIAAVPFAMLPTIIMSTMETSEVSVSSTSEGHAIRIMSLYRIRSVAPSVSCLRSLRVF